MRVRVVREGQWTVLAVSSDRGDCALSEFLQGLPVQMRGQRDRILALLNRIAASPHGPTLLPVEISHQIKAPLWQFEQGRLRVLWFYGSGRKIVVCSHGFVKRTRRTPQRELALAQAAHERYVAACKTGTLVIERE